MPHWTHRSVMITKSYSRLLHYCKQNQTRPITLYSFSICSILNTIWRYEYQKLYDKSFVIYISLQDQAVFDLIVKHELYDCAFENIISLISFNRQVWTVFENVELNNSISSVNFLPKRKPLMCWLKIWNVYQSRKSLINYWKTKCICTTWVRPRLAFHISLPTSSWC